jgi:hypothetical protein
MTSASGDAISPSSQPSGPSSGASDQQLDNELNAELATVRQGPHAPSEWATALGDTGLNLGGGAGGGYSFSPAELDAVIAQWHGVLQRAQGYNQQIHIITEVASAAADQASTGFTDQARALGTTLRTNHGSLVTYASDYIAKLQAAQQNYQNTEHATTASLNNQDPGDRP